MAQETVSHAIAALADSFAAGLECYAGWRQRQRRRNNYQTRRRTATGSGSPTCAASASLAISKLRIEEAFGNGADVLGDEFTSGDVPAVVYYGVLADVGGVVKTLAACRDVLLENLGRLRECVEILERAVGTEDRPLPLSELVRVSEAVRVSSLAALHRQYQRIVVGRLAPRVSSPSSPTPTLSPPSIDDRDVRGVFGEIEVEAAQTRGDRHSTGPETCSCNHSDNNYEPLSPPLTPTRVLKVRPDYNDDVSTYARSAAGFDSGPRNSVFSTFCPEAVKYQVDVEKALPAKGTRCRCGYDWNATCCTKDKMVMTIKDGFQITPRFLGKSHCESGLGCVLCTSSGRTETFRSVEGLKAHINSSHTKWQLLHDRDLTGC
ncbi:hypothetical protein F5B21DRAFT_512661 [Xylaria acuta]|nr:hypothetical protein F5B21DRAFT_512661 [Xylaria acuta]